MKTLMATLFGLVMILGVLAADQPGTGVTITSLGTDTICDEKDDEYVPGSLPKGTTAYASYQVSGVNAYSGFLFSAISINGGPMIIYSSSIIWPQGPTEAEVVVQFTAGQVRIGDTVELFMWGQLYPPGGGVCDVSTTPHVFTITAGC